MPSYIREPELNKTGNDTNAFGRPDQNENLEERKVSSHHSFNLHLHASCSQMITQRDEHHPVLFRYKHHKGALN
ncbi:hypothetical protein GA512_07875 [Bacillus paralicheniformis]|nr:hypothetical protein [Bacillus paralicheniformis]